MTNPPNIDAIIAELSEAQRRAISGIHISFGVNDVWRLDEGEGHAAYSALVRKGLLRKSRAGGWYTIYWLTPLGLAVRSALIGEVGRDG